MLFTKSSKVPFKTKPASVTVVLVSLRFIPSQFSFTLVPGKVKPVPIPTRKLLSWYIPLEAPAIDLSIDLNVTNIWSW